MMNVSHLLRCLPASLPGKSRLAHLLVTKHQRARAGIVTDQEGFAYEVPSLEEPIAFHLLVDGSYEPEVAALINQTLRRGGVFVDVGANIGAFTIPAAARVGEQGRVIAIEASPDVFPYLERNCSRNNVRNVHLLNAAAAAQDGIVEFYPAPAEKFGMGSMGAQFSGVPLKLNARSLDSLVRELGVARVDVMKIDVEGFELEVLKGARDLLLSNTPPLVVFEFCDWAEARISNAAVGDAQRWLLQQGFKLWRLKDFSRGRSPLTTPLERGFEMLVAFPLTSKDARFGPFAAKRFK
jgi:FkbM family methyltransferase